MAEKRDSAAVDITALQTALVGAVTSVFSSVKKEKKKPSTCDFSDSDDDPDDFIPKRPRTTSRLPLPLRFQIWIQIKLFYYCLQAFAICTA